MNLDHCFSCGRRIEDHDSAAMVDVILNDEHGITSEEIFCGRCYHSACCRECQCFSGHAVGCKTGAEEKAWEDYENS